TRSIILAIDSNIVSNVISPSSGSSFPHPLFDVGHDLFFVPNSVGHTRMLHSRLCPLVKLGRLLTQVTQQTRREKAIIGEKIGSEEKRSRQGLCCSIRIIP